MGPWTWRDVLCPTTALAGEHHHSNRRATEGVRVAPNGAQQTRKHTFVTLAFFPWFFHLAFRFPPKTGETANHVYDYGMLWQSPWTLQSIHAVAAL